MALDQEATTQLLCGATLGLIAAGRIFIRGQTLSVSGYLRNVAQYRHIALSKLLFLAGIAGAGILLSGNDSAALEPFPSDFPVWQAGVAGVLVGLGSVFGRGCETGHAISGSSALSPPSIIFLLISLASARFCAVNFSSPSLRNPPADSILDYGPETVGLAMSLFLFAFLAMAVSGFFGQGDEEEKRRGVSPAPQNFALYSGDVAEGVLFAYAAALGGYAKPSIILKGLSIWSPAFEPNLFYVLSGAFVAAFPAYLCVFRILRPSHSFSGAKNPKLSDALSLKLCLGAVLFGLGWGLSGISPLSGLVLLPSGSIPIVIFFTSMMVTYTASKPQQ